MEDKQAGKIRVLVVDDSHVTRKLYTELLRGDPRFELAGTASHGKDAIECVQELHPDIVSMDIEMPVMDGLKATRQIMEDHPVPILVVSNLYSPDKVGLAMDVLEAGALAIIAKPRGPGHPQADYQRKHYLNMLKSMSEVKVVRRRNLIREKTKSEIEQPGFSPGIKNAPAFQEKDYRVLLIGASAGGPDAIKTIISQLPGEFPLPILIVQHIDPHFAEAYRSWLQGQTSLKVQFATTNQALLPGHVYLPPGDVHMVVASEGMASLSFDPPVKGHRPCIASLFKSAQRVYCERVIAVILSGMGNDGAAELKQLKDCGALTLVQDEATSLVFGMPQEALRLGAAIKALSPNEMVKQIKSVLHL